MTRFARWKTFFKVGDVVKVRVLEVLKDERKIKLSMRGVDGNENLQERDSEEKMPTQEKASPEEAVEQESPAAESTPIESEVDAGASIELGVGSGEAAEPAADHWGASADELVSAEESSSNEEVQGRPRFRCQDRTDGGCWEGYFLSGL